MHSSPTSVLHTKINYKFSFYIPKTISKNGTFDGKQNIMKSDQTKNISLLKLILANKHHSSTKIC